MVEIKASIQIYGNNFSPENLKREIQIEFSSFIEKGSIGKLGRYKNKICPYGSATISPPEEVDHNDSIIWLIEYLSDKIDIIRKHGGQDMTLSIAYYPDGQCNCVFSLEEIEGLAKLKVPIHFSVYC